MYTLIVLSVVLSFDPEQPTSYRIDSVIRLPSVQRELELSSDQARLASRGGLFDQDSREFASAIDVLIEHNRQRLRDGKYVGLDELHQWQARIHRTRCENLNRTLTQSQSARLEQLCWQWMMGEGLEWVESTRPPLAGDQRSQIDKFASERAETLGNIRSAQKLALRTELLELLQPPQRLEWVKRFGEPFNFGDKPEQSRLFGQ